MYTWRITNSSNSKDKIYTSLKSIEMKYMQTETDTINPLLFAGKIKSLSELKFAINKGLRSTAWHFCAIIFMIQSFVQLRFGFLVTEYARNVKCNYGKKFIILKTNTYENVSVGFFKYMKWTKYSCLYLIKTKF